MNIIKAILSGILEGLTEFIPVSSTGHLIVFNKWIQFDIPNIETFEIAIQLGAILAVLTLYKSFFADLIKDFKIPLQKNSLNIAIAIVPVMILGFFCHSYIKAYLFSPNTVAVGLIIGACLMIITEIIGPRNHTHSVDSITRKQALGIGLSQCLALWPGMSRSGSTILGGLWTGVDHKTAAKFSFIIAVPVMIIAVTYDLLKTAASITLPELGLIGIGFGISYCVAIVSIVYFLRLFEKIKLIPFAIYRIILGIVILVSFSG